MTAIEVAAALRVSRATIYRLVRSGVLPAVQVGRSVRVSRNAVDAFLRGSSPPAAVTLRLTSIPNPTETDRITPTP